MAENADPNTGGQPEHDQDGSPNGDNMSVPLKSATVSLNVAALLESAFAEVNLAFRPNIVIPMQFDAGESANQIENIGYASLSVSANGSASIDLSAAGSFATMFESSLTFTGYRFICISNTGGGDLTLTITSGSSTYLFLSSGTAGLVVPAGSVICPSKPLGTAWPNTATLVFTAGGTASSVEIWAGGIYSEP